MKLVFGSDHAGYALRVSLAEFARGLGHSVTEVGASSEASYDYPRAGARVAHQILDGEADMGVAVCGSGVGICIAANRHPGIRAAVLHSEDEAKMARLHNDANVACFGARTITMNEAVSLLKVFLSTEKDEGERHARRIAMLDQDVV